MAEYINRDLFAREVNRLSTTPFNEWDTMGILLLLDTIPSADVQPVVHGYWKSEDKMFGNIPFKCSNCGYLTRETTDGSVLGKPKFNYCPICGADMRGKSDG